MIKEGDIILVHNKRINTIPLFLGAIIRLLTKSFYNHSANVVLLYGELYVYEAIGKGCVITQRLKDYLQDNSRVLEVVSTNVDITEYRKRVKETIGKKYDYTSLLWHYILFLITKKWYGHTHEHSTKKFVCFELSMYLHNKKWWGITAKDIIKEFKTYDTKRTESSMGNY